MRAELATKADLESVRTGVADLRSEVVEVKPGMPTLRKELAEQIMRLRRAVIEYHTSVIGHGVPISEHQARMRPVQQRLNLSSPTATLG